MVTPRSDCLLLAFIGLLTLDPGRLEGTCLTPLEGIMGAWCVVRLVRLVVLDFSSLVMFVSRAVPTPCIRVSWCACTLHAPTELWLHWHAP